ncbi:MAG: hypothetical protein HOV83_13785 [Catenulispora sp.]|nr:hypothetical protein [Catenulispora sp.]
MASIALDDGELVTFDPWNFSGLRVHGGVDLESVLVKIASLVLVEECRRRRLRIACVP